MQHNHHHGVLKAFLHANYVQVFCSPTSLLPREIFRSIHVVAPFFISDKFELLKEHHNCLIKEVPAQDFKVDVRNPGISTAEDKSRILEHFLPSQTLIHAHGNWFLGDGNPAKPVAVEPLLFTTCFTDGELQILHFSSNNTTQQQHSSSSSSSSSSPTATTTSFFVVLFPSFLLQHPKISFFKFKMRHGESNETSFMCHLAKCKPGNGSYLAFKVARISEQELANAKFVVQFLNSQFELVYPVPAPSLTDVLSADVELAGAVLAEDFNVVSVLNDVSSSTDVLIMDEENCEISSEENTDMEYDEAQKSYSKKRSLITQGNALWESLLGDSSAFFLANGAFSNALPVHEQDILSFTLRPMQDDLTNKSVPTSVYMIIDYHILLKSSQQQQQEKPRLIRLYSKQVCFHNHNSNSKKDKKQLHLLQQETTVKIQLDPFKSKFLQVLQDPNIQIAMDPVESRLQSIKCIYFETNSDAQDTEFIASITMTFSKTNSGSSISKCTHFLITKT